MAAAPTGGSSSAGGDGDAFTITTPLYYVNAAPHMGSAYPTIAADVLARYNRMTGRKVTFVTGTDEHGEKIALAAAARGLEPQAHCDAIVEEYKSLWGKLDIRYDSFVRTTDEKHEALVTRVLERVWERGDVYRADYEGWYCVDCEEYKDEGDMDEHKNCPMHRKPCVERKEDNYFFKLSAYQKQLEELLEQDGGAFVQPAARRNEVMGWVKGGVRDFSISRAAVDWGIRVPRDPKQTVYVWFDALLGYLSALFPHGTEPSIEGLAAQGWPASVHVIGKDILRFHAVYWPGMLLSAGLPLPKMVFGHGFLTKDGLKMGKSLGNVLEPLPLVEAYGPDAVRYYFMREMELGKDGDFSEQRFRDIVNAALANDIGNLLNRTLNLLKKNCGGALPIAAAELPEDHPLRVMAADKAAAAAAGYEGMRLAEAAAAALALSSRGNQYLEEVAPWTAFKKGSDEDKDKAGRDLVAVLEAVRVAAVLLAPITPSLSSRIYEQLGLDAPDQLQSLSWAEATQWGGLQSGHQTPKPTPVFARLEGDYVTEPAPAAAAAVPA